MLVVIGGGEGWGVIRGDVLVLCGDSFRSMFRPVWGEEKAKQKREGLAKESSQPSTCPVCPLVLTLDRCDRKGGCAAECTGQYVARYGSAATRPNVATVGDDPAALHYRGQHRRRYDGGLLGRRLGGDSGRTAVAAGAAIAAAKYRVGRVKVRRRGRAQSIVWNEFGRLWCHLVVEAKRSSKLEPNI